MSTEPAERPVRIAVVEDNAADVYLLEKALHRAQVSYDLYPFANGEAALHFFLQGDPYRDAPRPDLLMLDLNVPASMASSCSNSCERGTSFPRLRSLPSRTPPPHTPVRSWRR